MMPRDVTEKTRDKKPPHIVDMFTAFVINFKTSIVQKYQTSIQEAQETEDALC